MEGTIAQMLAHYASTNSLTAASMGSAPSQGKLREIIISYESTLAQTCHSKHQDRLEHLKILHPPFDERSFNKQVV